MSTGILPSHPPFADPPPEDPFFYGWRYVPWSDEHGETKYRMTPLTEWDVLHPQEDDHFVITPAHDNDCAYIKAVFQDQMAARSDAIVFHDMRIDFQEGEDSVYGPDVSIFEHLNAPFDLGRGTFPVKDMGAAPVVAVEVVSPSSENLDRVVKVSDYFRMGVPLYVIVDRESVNGESVVSVYGYQALRKGYKRVPVDPRGVWVDSLRVWVRGVGNRAVCFDAEGNRFPDRPELIEQLDRTKKLAEQERQRAEQERQRAEQERQRAEQERQRAEQERRLREAAAQQAAAADQRAADMARKMAEMEAELRRIRGEPK